MKKSDLKQIKKLEKMINKEKDLNNFELIDDANSYEEFIIRTSKRDYFNNVNNQNTNGRGSESGVGSYLTKEVYKAGTDSIVKAMTEYLEKKGGSKSPISKFFMMNTTFLNLDETKIDKKAVKASVVITSKIIINEVLKSTNYELLENDGSLGLYNNYIKILSTYRKVGVAILEEQILNSVIIQQPELAKSVTNRHVNGDIFTKFNMLAQNNKGVKCVLKNGKDQDGNVLLNTNPYDKDNDVVKIGAFFVNILVNNVDIFDTKQMSSGKQNYNMLALNQKFLQKIANFEDMNSMLKPRFLPRPSKFGRFKQWNGLEGGCFEHIDVDFIKNVRRDIRDKLKPETYMEIYQAANNLQNTEFSINKTVYNTINLLMNADTRFRNKKGKLILPYRAGKLIDELPALPKHLEKEKDRIKEFSKARNEWYNKQKTNGKSKAKLKLPSRLDIKCQSVKFQKIYDEYKEYQIKVRLENEFLQANTSKYSSILQALSIAKMMGDEGFYIASQIDWRTRYYYMSVLNPQTSDNIKAILSLGQSKRVSKDDEMYFLYNCGANDYGHDKKHPDFKRDWVLENMDIIAECGRNPMENIEFWAEADKPFMFLNFCSEIAQYVDNGKEYLDSKYICFFDGSCNGSQHFAAMTGDRQTATLTNLTNEKERHDLYSVVAKTTTRFIEEIRDGKHKDTLTIKNKFGNTVIKLHDYYKDHCEETLAYGISRALVKQNVMTMTYGSTQFGRKDQVEAVYKGEIQKKVKLPFGQETIGFKASLVSNVAYGAIAKENPGVVSAMNWLEDCMAVFGKVFFRNELNFLQEGLSPVWKGKTGAEVIQSYQVKKTESIRFRVDGKLLLLSQKVDKPKSDVKKGTQGIIANVTHYQDATHMTKCINECAKYFSDFVCVHDSFGVSVKDASKLYNIVRYTFADMYDTPFLDELYDQWYKQISEYDLELAMTLPRPPSRGDYDVSESLDSVYSFI